MSAELEKAIEAFFEAQRHLTRLAGPNLDSVVDPNGTTLLLPDAQRHLLVTEAALHESVALLSAVLDALPANIALLDRCGRIAMVNGQWRRFAEANGYASEDLGLGKNYLSVCSAGDKSGDDATAISSGIQAVLEGRVTSFTAEYPCHSPTERRWFQVVVVPMPESTKKWGAVVMHIDITSRKLAELETDSLKLRFQTLVEEAVVGVLVHRDFKPLLANSALARLLGYADTQTILRMTDCRVIYAEEDRSRASDYNALRRRKGAAPPVYEIKIRRADDSVIHVECRVFLIDWEGEPATCAMFADISERRAVQLQLLRSQRLEAIGQLTGGIAHDFNNLLQVVLGNSEILEAALGEDRRLGEVAAATRAAAERGAELTRHLLAFARRQPLAPAVTNINELLSNMASVLRRTLGGHIEIETSSGKGLWSALVDPAQLESAVLNLCINARDAMQQGGKVTIETTNASFDEAPAGEIGELARGDYVLVTVSDTGHGMSAEVKANAFEPFFTTKEVGKGSGLGLSMVYGFAKQSGGHVAIYSELGRGTTVRLYLPRASDPDRPVRESLKTALPHGTERVLMVEDDEFVRVHVHQQLVDLGYSVTVATNAHQALELLNQEAAYDLLFTDIVMPGGMDGQQLAQEALKMRPGLPVLFTSGYTDGALMDQGRLDPERALLVKPYRKRDLALKLRQVLRDARPSPSATRED